MEESDWRVRGGRNGVEDNCRCRSLQGGRKPWEVLAIRHQGSPRKPLLKRFEHAFCLLQLFLLLHDLLRQSLSFGMISTVPVTL